MRKSLLGILVGFFCLWASVSVFASVDIPNLPHTVPYSQYGLTYTHITVYEFSWGSPHHVTHIIYCPDNIEVTGELNQWGAFNLWPSGNGCRQWQTNDNGQTYQTSDYAWPYSTDNPSAESKAGPLSAILASTKDIKAHASRNWNGDFGFNQVTAGDKILDASSFGGGGPIKFSFPFNSDTAYTASVSSVMDQTTLGSGAVYEAGEDGEVETFEGEIGDVGPYNGGVNGNTCYRKSDSTAFGTSFNYIGTSVTGGENYLCYDAHPGYDYPAPRYTNINAPADGTLCVATSTTQQPYPVDVWRDTTHCPYSTAGSTSWSGYHTFYIIHKGLYINGSTNDYMTVFLHSDDLESSVRDDIEQYGYATVTKSQHVAESGDIGSPGSYHMHIEVYKKNGESWDRVDPYGDGTNNILWEQN